MSYTFYHVLHLFSLFVLVSLTVVAITCPRPEFRRKVLAFSGIAGLVTLITGFGLAAKIHVSPAASWVIVKILCWLGLSMIAGLAFRKPEKNKLWYLITSALVLGALVTVSTRFGG